MKRQPLILAMVLLASVSAVASAAGLEIHTESLDFHESTSVEGTLALLEITGPNAAPASWQGNGETARLDIHGSRSNTSTPAVTVTEESYSKTIEFSEWTLDSGAWSEGHQVLIGVQAGMEATVRLDSSGSSDVTVTSEQQRSQGVRFYHPEEPVPFRIKETLQWKGLGPRTVVITGDFVVTSWFADMVLSDSEHEPEAYRSGTYEEPVEGLEPAQGAVYVTERRINNLYVTNGELRLDITDADSLDLFLWDADTKTQGDVMAEQAFLLEDGQFVDSGPLVVDGPSNLTLAPTDSSSRIAVSAPGTMGSWSFNGEPLVEPTPGLPSGQSPDQDSTAANPIEGHVPAWLQALSWIALALAFLLVAEGIGFTPWLRTKWRLRTYNYDAIQPRQWWTWFPGPIRNRMYFAAAVAAAGREDHENAVIYASRVSVKSKQWLPSRFVSIQSLAAQGQRALAAFELDDLVTRDIRYKVLAAENPFLASLVGGLTT